MSSVIGLVGIELKSLAASAGLLSWFYSSHVSPQLSGGAMPRSGQVPL